MTFEDELYAELVETLNYSVSQNDSVEDAAAYMMDVFMSRNLYVDADGAHLVEGSDSIAIENGFVYRTIWYPDYEENEDE